MHTNLFIALLVVEFVEENCKNCSHFLLNTHHNFVTLSLYSVITHFASSFGLEHFRVIRHMILIYRKMMTLSSLPFLVSLLASNPN